MSFFAPVIALMAMIQTIPEPLCVPRAASVVASQRAARTARGIKNFKTGCTPNASGLITCDPDSMRATTEAKLHSLGLYAPSKRLTMAVYAMARNIGSEAGDNATAAEKLAIGETLVTRAAIKGVSQFKLMTRDGHFARQKGRNPAVSSARDPQWEDIVAAELVLSGRSGDVSRGATHYFAPKAQDSLFASGRVSNNRTMIYDSWTSGGDLLTWVGYTPGIDKERQFFFKPLPKTAAGRAEHDRMRSIGRQALVRATPASILSAPSCSSRQERRLVASTGGIIFANFENQPGAPTSKIAMAGTVMAVMALPTFLILRYGRGV